MFKALNEEIKRLNSEAKTVANCQKATALRNKLLKIGLPMAIGGFLGVFICFILFVTAGFDAFSPNGGFSARVLVPFILFLPCGAVGGIGASIASLGFRILVTGYTTNLVDETVGNNCPDCGDPVDQDEIFCSKCGKRLKIECPSCGKINGAQDKFCKNCGKELPL